MIKYYRLPILLFIVMLSGCMKHENPPPSIPDNINIEMFGSWANENGCSATFAKDKDKIFLVKFSDGHDRVYNDIILFSKKESILTKFEAMNHNLKFSGTFVEGVIVINDYCTDPLHKIDN